MATAIGDLVATMDMNLSPFQRRVATAKSTMKSLGGTIVQSLRFWEKSSKRMGDTSETALKRYTRRVKEAKAATLAGTKTASQYAVQMKILKDTLDRETLAEKRRAAAIRQSTIASRNARRAAVGRVVRGAGRGALVGATLAVAGAAVAGRTAEEFNQEFRSSLAIMQNVTAEMRAEMQKTAFDVARTSKFGASEAAKSYFFLASAGLDAAQSVKALPVVTQFATAGMFDLSKATDLLTDAQSALGKTVKDPIKNLQNMTALGDKLVKANTLANASVEQFSEALTNKAAAAMRLVNLSVSEGIAVLAVFADQGLKGAEAGTAFAIVMRDLQTKSIKNKEEFQKLGVAVFDSTGKFNKMSDIIGDLETALFGLSDEQKKATLLQLGFSDKSVAFTQILLGTSEQIRDYERSIDEAGGTMKKVADSQLTPFAKGMAAVGAAFAEFSVESATGPMAEMGKAMEQLAKPGGDLETMLNGIVDAIDDANTGLLKAIVIMKRYAIFLDLAQGKLPDIDFGAVGDPNAGRRLGDRNFEIEALEQQIRDRQKATKERLATRARGGAPLPLTEAERFTKMQEEFQKGADRNLRRNVNDLLKLQALAGNIERAKDMEVIAEREKTAKKIREGFVANPFQALEKQLAQLEKSRGPGGLTEAEFKRGVGEARQAAIEAIKKEKVKPTAAETEGTRRIKAAQTEAERIRKGLRTPAQRLQDKINRVRELATTFGGLTPGEAKKEIARLKREAGGQIQPTAGPIAERGTDVAFQAILASMRDDPSEKAAEETATNTADMRDSLLNIDANLQPVGIGDVIA